jgi:hypothetical protein
MEESFRCSLFFPVAAAAKISDTLLTANRFFPCPAEFIDQRFVI